MLQLRPRISLLTALLLMTILALALVTAQLWREVGPLRQEVHQLRDEVGKLSIDDETKIHAIEARTTEPLTWKWRVWVPQSKRVAVRAEWGQVPRIGFPQGGATTYLDPGEHWIVLRAQRNPNGDGWTNQLETESGSAGGSIQPGDRWWEWPMSTSTGEGIGFTTVIVDDDQKPFLLKRTRVAAVNSSSIVQKMDAPTAGFIIWLEPQ